MYTYKKCIVNSVVDRLAAGNKYFFFFSYFPGIEQRKANIQRKVVKPRENTGKGSNLTVIIVERVSVSLHLCIYSSFSLALKYVRRCCIYSYKVYIWFV